MVFDWRTRPELSKIQNKLVCPRDHHYEPRNEVLGLIATPLAELTDIRFRPQHGWKSYFRRAAKLLLIGALLDNFIMSTKELTAFQAHVLAEAFHPMSDELAIEILAFYVEYDKEIRDFAASLKAERNG